MKRIVCAALVFMGAVFLLPAQQRNQPITRFAVVDLVRIYNAFFDAARATKEFNERSAKIQEQINRLTAELQELKTSLAGAQAAGEEDKAARLEQQVNQKTRSIQEYYQTSMAELETQKAKLIQSDAFFTQINDQIRIVAESNGYSLVFNKQENSAILWYSPSVDITNQVIESLRGKAKR
ncbi:MAG: OmpH family outer membrane protein [Treponema sp.]|jgi:outer membrane protein|nr:OmpH family outer membrane protein [Treponema sp.]